LANSLRFLLKGRKISRSIEATSKQMMIFSQSPRDRVLWILANHAGKLERSNLRRRMGMRYALMNPILGELAGEGRIILLPSPTGKEMGIIRYR